MAKTAQERAEAQQWAVRVQALENEIERLTAERDVWKIACNAQAAEVARLRGHEAELYAVLSERNEQAAEIERLQELLRGVGANRYWEDRWRDEKAENERLRARLEHAAGSA
jgi:chromosome segregation ATPase